MTDKDLLGIIWDFSIVVWHFSWLKRISECILFFPVATTGFNALSWFENHQKLLFFFNSNLFCERRPVKLSDVKTTVIDQDRMQKTRRHFTNLKRDFILCADSKKRSWKIPNTQTK